MVAASSLRRRPARRPIRPNPSIVVFPYPGGLADRRAARDDRGAHAKIVGQPFVTRTARERTASSARQPWRRRPGWLHDPRANDDSAFLLNSYLRKDLPYDPVKNSHHHGGDRYPGESDGGVQLPVKNTRELVEYLKKIPERSTTPASVTARSITC